ncbi:MAG: AraC family transcriptional regulator [Ignavibacteria bacterium]|jgi:AraC family transcriptional regulator
MKNSEKSFEEYRARIQRVVKFINENITKNLDLYTLSKEAYFSPFHFHRIFSSMLKETPQDFVKRVRLERAANILLNSKRSVTEVAFDCGFSSSAVFSRAFKNHFGLSASTLRKEGEEILNSKNCKSISKPGKILAISQDYFGNVIYDFQNNQRSTKMKVEVKRLSDMRVAFVSWYGGYKADKIKKTWDRVCQWGAAHNQLGPDTKCIGISYDNPDITPEEKCRYDACITISSDVKPTGGVDELIIKGGKYGIYRFEGKDEEIKLAYKSLYGDWLPNSGFEPNNNPCIEIYHKTPDEEPKGIFIMDICIPVKPI